MKKFVLLLTTLNILLITHAKGFDVDYEISQTPYKFGGKNGNVFECIIAEEEDHYLALRSTTANIYIGLIPIFIYDLKIAIYDKNTLNLEEVYPLFPKKGYIVKGKFKPSSLWGVKKYKDKIYALFGYKDQKKDEVSVYQQYLTEEGDLDGEPTKLVEGKFRKGMAGNFVVTYSSDSSKVLLVYEVPTKNKENQQYKFYVYSCPDFEALKEQEVELPIKDKDVNLIDYDVDNDGNVYGLLKIYDKPEKGTKKTDKFIYKILGFSSASEDYIEYEFDIEQHINSMTFQVKNGEIFCTGFWGKKSPSDISGVYTIKLSAETGEEKIQDIYEFSDEFIEEFFTEKQVDKANKKGKELEVPEIRLDYFHVNADGSAYLIGEQFYIYQVCYSTGNGGTKCYWVYVHNDIIATKIDSEGQIEWSIKIPKKSRYNNGDGHMGYHFTMYKDELYFFYYDHTKNLKAKDPKKLTSVPFFGKDLDLICTKVDKEGEKEKIKIYNYNQNNLRTYPTLYQNMKGSQIIGQGMVKGRKEVLVRFDIKD